MSRASVASPLILACLVGMGISPAIAEPDFNGGVQGDTVFVAAVEATNSGVDADAVTTAAGAEPLFIEYRWASACATVNAAPDDVSFVDCGAARSCASPEERLWRLWGRSEGGGWTALGAQCFGSPPTGEDAPEIVITPGMVLNEIRRIGLPTLQAYTQPEGKTLVNFATIFYTEPEPFTRTVSILGQSVELEATPVQYTWHHGDGTSKTTSGPGAPYPSKEITHHYRDARTTVTPRVDVTYSARFRVNGGGWQDIDQTVTIQGPTSDLRVSEATAVLSGSYD